MDEEIKKEAEDKKPKEAAPNTDVGVSSKKEKSNIEKIKETTEAQKLENDRKVELLDREEKLMERKEALAALGGGSEAGQQKVVETEDEKWAKDAKERYAGTGMSPLPDEQ